MGHILFAATDGPRPELPAGALDRNTPGYRLERHSDDQLGTDGACSQLRRGQIQVVVAFEFVIGKLVALGKADSPGYSAGIRPGTLRRFPAPHLRLRQTQVSSMARCAPAGSR